MCLPAWNWIVNVQKHKQKTMSREGASLKRFDVVQASLAPQSQAPNAFKKTNTQIDKRFIFLDWRNRYFAPSWER